MGLTVAIQYFQPLRQLAAAAAQLVASVLLGQAALAAARQLILEVRPLELLDLELLTKGMRVVPLTPGPRMVLAAEVALGL